MEELRVAGVVEVYLPHVRSVIIAALTESEGTVSGAICRLQDGFPFRRLLVLLIRPTEAHLVNHR